MLNKKITSESQQKINQNPVPYETLYSDICTWKISTNDLSGSYWEMQDHLHNDYCLKEIGQLVWPSCTVTQSPSDTVFLITQQPDVIKNVCSVLTHSL